MVDWEVASNLTIVERGYSDVELGIEMAYFQQPGSFECRKQFKQLECQYAFPRCSGAVAVQSPCRSVCEDFARRCPGADVQCNSYPTERCLLIDLSHADTARSASLALSVVLASLLRVLFSDGD